MKIYGNKLYCIQDAAKRGGIKEDQLLTMVIDNVVDPARGFYRPPFIRGEDIPGLKKKWEKYQKKLSKKKKGGSDANRL